MAHSTTVTLPMGKLDIQESTTAVLEHLMINPPSEQTIEYNMGVNNLFEVLRSTFKSHE